MPEPKTCKAYRQGDQMRCDACNLTWDMNDPEPPECRRPGQVILEQLGVKEPSEALLRAAAKAHLETTRIALDKIVLRVHDELIVEVPEGRGSVEEFERLMAMMDAVDDMGAEL